MPVPSPTPLPASLVYGTVSWTVVGIGEDTNDADANPDADQIDGWVTFTAAVSKVVKPSPSPVTVLPRPEKYRIVNGQLVDAENRTAVKLVGNDSPGVSPVGWSYHADFQLDDGYTFGSFDFYLAGNQVLDLSDVQPLLTPEPGVVVIRGNAATITVDSTTTGAPGSAASVQNVGDQYDAHLVFTVPQGPVGPIGPGVPSGGAANQIIVHNGTTTQWEDTTSAATASLVMRRDSAGRVQAAAGAVAADVVVKSQLDAVSTVANAAVPSSQKGVAGGVASLDTGTKVPVAQLPVGTASGVAGLDAGSKVPLAQLPAGTASGLATLDAGGKLAAAQIPAIAISDFLGVVASQAAMLALTGQRGDWATRSDLGYDFILIADDPTQLASWRQITSPAGGVTSVAGRSGAVTLTSADLTDVKTSLLMRWKANTNYTAGDVVLNPSGQLVSAIATFTSGAVYSAANWTTTISSDMVSFTGTGIVATNVHDALLEVLGYSDDAGDIWSSSTRTLNVNAGTYVTDSDLNVPIAANQVIWLDYYLSFSGPTTSTANLRAQFVLPAGCAAEWGSALDYDAAGSGGTAKGNLGTATDVKTFKLNTGNTGVHIRAKITNGATAGTISIQFSPDTTTASAVVRNIWSKVAYSRAQ